VTTPVIKNLDQLRPVNAVDIAKAGDVIVIEATSPLTDIPVGYTLYGGNVAYRIADGSGPSPFLIDNDFKLWIIDGDSIEWPDPASSGQ